MNYRLVIVFCFATITCFCQNGNLRDQQRDFDIFYDGLHRIESRLDRHTSLDSVEHILAEAKTAFYTSELSPIEQFNWYARCINLVASGHTQAQPSRKVLKAYVLAKKSLPFDLVMVNKHLYTNGYPAVKGRQPKRDKSTEIVKGTEIIAIDGKSIDSWMNEIGLLIGSDEDDPAFEYFVAGQAFDLYRFLVTKEHKESLEVTTVNGKDTQSRSVTLSYPPIELIQQRFKAAERQAEKDSRKPGTFKLIGSDVAYFRFTTFLDAIGKDYSEFLAKSFKKIDKKKTVKTVVIDVRGNGGGNVQTELISYFLDKQQIVGSYTIDKRLKPGERKHIVKNTRFFRLYKKGVRRSNRYEKRHPDYNGELMSYPVDTALVFKGEIIVLTDEATFSAASLLASQLKTLCNAQVMGSRAGGSFYACNAGTLTYKLPHSGISFILNPNTCASTLNASTIDPTIKNVDKEIIPEYDPKPSVYKKNWEGVIKKAIRAAKK